MSIYRYKGSKVWTLDFMFHAQRIRESTGTRSKTLAQKIEDKRRRELEQGAAGLNSKRNRPLLFSAAAEEYLRMKVDRWEAKTHLIAENNLAHLLPVFSKSLLVDIEAPDIRTYQKSRLAEGHFGLEDLRSAVETISRPAEDVCWMLACPSPR